ncbi:hypothetical protein BEWA_034360 [Theileria equi strain WA]|uniref:Uncharacterized protein n=1 Tax=Theileria equi strain WA TaxID=1537102 RepID=L0B0B6_THEEQ|nr:hypothetical protein BEWA_034360 [Theileria equi strain WA]AFZ80579.1 hypothetical protein BEWA_034360 [Theileria equi strain WA]|eukprot:XP_004830245.1 hypothetical protein BEWA_034360 [Theileria equi strain WA]
MTGNGVTIQIGYYPGSGGQVKQDGGGYYYDSDGNGRVNLTDEWFPDPEGIYRKFTHTPEDGCTIGDIRKGRILSEITSLEKYSSVSVYYWSQDHACSKPLIIQLGEGNSSVYYTISDGGDNWNNDSDSSIANDLRKKLDGRNCSRNNAHIIDLSNKGTSGSGKNYQCPSCSQQKLRVYKSSDSGGITFYSGRGSMFSVTSFKDKGGNSWQAGFPSLKDVKEIKVYWNESGRKTPLLIVYQSIPQRYFRRSSGNSNTWIRVSNADGLPNGGTPTITTLDLSSSSGKYNDGSSSIDITVLRSHIGDGFYRYQYSLRGSLFEVTEIRHDQTPLTGIDSSDILTSISGFYYGGNTPTDQSNILLIEVVTSENKYSYYQKDKDGTNWAELRRPGGYISQLIGEPLKVTLINLKKLKETLDKLDQLSTQLQELERKLNESHNTGTLAGSSVGTGLGGAGLGGLAVWKGPALLAKLIARL